MDTQSLLEAIKREDYYENLRVLDDGTIIGTGKLMFTTALYVGINLTGWERRYCYKDMKALKQSLDSMTTSDDEPHGYIARRGT